MPGFTSSSPQAMHNAFQTDDVVREVFLHLRPPLDAPHRPSRHDRQTLYRAALVSRRFSSLAVDALWRAMYDFRPLLKLIPGIEYKTEIGVRILRPLCSEDFLAFDRYSRKIKAYHTHDDPFPISVPLIFEILHWLGRSHLLPSLSLLRIVNEITDNQYSLFCPSVRQLSIYLDQEEEALSLISHLVWATPGLMELEVEESPLVPEVLSLLGQMGSLTTLKLQNHLIVDPKSFNKNFPFAGRLRSLTVQSVSFLPSSVTQSQISMANNRGSVQFSALTHLVLSDPISVESITPIFSHSLFPCVEDLSLTLPDRVHGRNASIALFSAIFGRKNCLRRIMFLCEKAVAESRMSKRVGDEIEIGDLLQNAVPQNIHTFHITTDLLSSLSIPSIQAFAQIFAGLRDLTLYLPQTNLLSFNNLAELGRLLPHLVRLQIGIDGRNLTEDCCGIPLGAHHLKCLLVWGVRMDNPIVFARYVDRIFPFATISHPPPRTMREEMEKVGVALKMMKSCRQDESARTLKPQD